MLRGAIRHLSLSPAERAYLPRHLQPGQPQLRRCGPVLRRLLRRPRVRGWEAVFGGGRGPVHPASPAQLARSGLGGQTLPGGGVPAGRCSVVRRGWVITAAGEVGRVRSGAAKFRRGGNAESGGTGGVDVRTGEGMWVMRGVG